VSALKTARDEAAKRLSLDPGVLCSRDRMEAVARRNPASVSEVMEVTELRRWQAEELAVAFVTALEPHRKPALAGDGAAPAAKEPSRSRAKRVKEEPPSSGSPYKE
jgi:hypothetical protein